MTAADPSRPPSAAPAAPAVPGATPAPVDWSEESTAGEEDPGASLDMALDPPPQTSQTPQTPAQPPSTPPEAAPG